MAHTELGRALFTKIKSELFMVSKIERDAKMEGRRMTLVLQPDHKAPGTKPPPPPGTRSTSAGPTSPRPTPAPAGSRLNIPAPAAVQAAAPTPEPATR